MKEKLEAFRAKVEADQIAGLKAQGYNPAHHDHRTRVVMGRKYAKVDVGTSGKYMVDLATGEIFGIKAYGVIHRGYCFGTLDTIDDFDWSGYRGVKKPAGGQTLPAAIAPASSAKAKEPTEAEQFENRIAEIVGDLESRVREAKVESARLRQARKDERSEYFMGHAAGLEIAAAKLETLREDYRKGEL